MAFLVGRLEIGVTMLLCFVVTLPGVLLNLFIVYISVYKVDKPYKWFLANLAVSDLIFAVATMIGQPFFMLRQLKDPTLSLDNDFVRLTSALSLSSRVVQYLHKVV